MGFEMGKRWRDLAHEITADDTVGAVLLDAAGPAFCAGGDVIETAANEGCFAEFESFVGIDYDPPSTTTRG